MPTYEYRCGKCGNFEYFQKITESALTTCPHCDGTDLKRLLSLSSFQLKGSGWYKTDYASSCSGKPSSCPVSNNGESKTDTTSACSSCEALSKNVEKSADSSVTKEKKSATTSSDAGGATCCATTPAASQS